MKHDRETLSDRVATDLFEMITIEKRFQPGDKLPNEYDLCRELSVSRTTLREAIRSLIMKGIVEVRRGKGTYVSDKSDLGDDLGFGELDYVLVKARDIFEMRLIIEPQAAYLATQRATDFELERILKYGRLVETKILSQEPMMDDEQLFHTYIAKATHNEFMMRVVPIINKGIWRGIRGLKDDAALQDVSIKTRRMLLEFFEKRNAEGAKMAMYLHVMLGMMKIGLEP